MKRFSTLIFLIFLYCHSFAQTGKLDNEQLLDMIQGQRYTEAANYIKASFPDVITDPKIKSRLAYCNYMSGNLAEAEKSYLSILFADTTNRTALTYLAAINGKRGNYLRSKLFYLKILKLDTTNFTIYKQLATTAQNLGDSAGVYSYLLKANKLSPRDPDVAYDLTDILLKKKNYPLADSVLKIAIEAEPQNILLINNRMELAHKLKDYIHSVAYAKQAIALGDIAAQTHGILAIGDYYLKNYAECIQINKAFENTPNANETTYYYTALSYRQLDSLQKSNDYLDKSIAAGISDNVPIYYQELSINNEKLLKFKTSVAQLDKAEEFQSKNIFNYSRARIYDVNLKDPKNALKYYKRYVKEYDAHTDDKDCYAYSAQRVKELSLPKELSAVKK